MGVEDTLRAVGFALVRFTSFSANALIFGAVPLLLLVARPAFAGLGAAWDAGRRRVAERLEGLVQAALIGSAAATAIGLLLQVTLVSELREGEVDAPSFRSVIETSFGQWYLLRLPLLAAGAVLLVGKVREWSLPGLAGGGRGAGTGWWVSWGALGAALLATITFSGHAAASEPQVLSIVNNLVHFLAAATWFTGIVMLAIVIPDGWRGKSPVERLDLLAPSVLRFSRVALTAIVVVGATGILNSFLRVGALGDLVGSGYGRALAIKIGLFGGILAIGGLNHLVVRHRLLAAMESREQSPAQPLFRKTIAAELVVAVSLMAITGVLTGQAPTRRPPPAEVPADAAGPAPREAPAGSLSAQVLHATPRRQRPELGTETIPTKESR